MGVDKRRPLDPKKAVFWRIRKELTFLCFAKLLSLESGDSLRAF